jgi:cytochrome c-type biogenesis protein CcmH
MPSRAALALLAPVLVALAVAPPAPAAPASFTDVEDEVMCDTCNVPLHIAESPRADQLRREIRVLIADGRSKDEVKATLKERYGPAVLALPQDSGFSLTAYLVPILVALGLLALALVLLPRWRRRAREPALAGAPGTALDDVDEQRLDDELRRFDAP